MTYNPNGNYDEQMAAASELDALKVEVEILRNECAQRHAIKAQCSCDNEECRNAHYIHAVSKRDFECMLGEHQKVMDENKGHMEILRERDQAKKMPVSRYANRSCGCTRVECQQYFSDCVNWEQQFLEVNKEKEKYFGFYAGLTAGNQRTADNWRSNRDFHEKQIKDLNSEVARHAMNASQWKYKCENLEKVKDKPWCREEMIMGLEKDIEKANKSVKYLNDVVWRANRSQEVDQATISSCKQKIQEHEQTIKQLEVAVTDRDELIDALRTARPDELQHNAFDICTNIVCKRRINMANMMAGARNTELRELEEENTRLKDDLMKAEHDRNLWKSEHDKAIQGDCEMLREAALERPVEVVESEQRRIDLVPVMDEELKVLFNTLFVKTGTMDKAIEETKLYDDFVNDQPPSKRLAVLKKVYSACHEGRQMPEQESKRFNDDPASTGNGRIAKQSFAACLKAMGGISKKKGTRSVWLNIRVRHDPVFANKIGPPQRQNRIL